MIADGPEASAPVDETKEIRESEAATVESMEPPPMAAPPPPVEAAPNPLDPLGINAAGLRVWQAMVTNPEALIRTQLEFANAWMSVAGGALAPGAKRAAAIEPAKGDTRFRHPAWTENPIFDALKQGYLLATKAVLDGIDRSEVDPETKQRVKFFAKQFCDAMSPSNFAFLNPAVIEETLRTGGRNLERGAQNVLEDVRENAGRPALVNKKAFKVGKNIATTPGAVVFRNDLIELIEYTPTTETVFAQPLVIVPPWINKYYILDLQPANSFIKFAVDSGFRTFVASWRNPDASLAGMGWKDYLELGPLTACRVASSITESQEVNVLGYCIGGTLTAEMLAYLARSGEVLVNTATFFAALTDFEDAGEIRAFLGPEAMAFIEDSMKKKGILDGAQMADTFNMLRANDLIWNVAVNRYLMGKDAPAFDLLLLEQRLDAPPGEDASLLPPQHVHREQPGQAGQTVVQRRSDRPARGAQRRIHRRHDRRSYRAVAFGLQGDPTFRRRRAVPARSLGSHRGDYQLAEQREGSALVRAFESADARRVVRAGARPRGLVVDSLAGVARGARRRFGTRSGGTRFAAIQSALPRSGALRPRQGLAPS